MTGTAAPRTGAPGSGRAPCGRIRNGTGRPAARTRTGIRTRARTRTRTRTP